MPKVKCIDNSIYPAAFKLGKEYQLLPNTCVGLLKVKDESGEFYLFPEEMFERVLDTELILERNASIKRLSKRLKKEKDSDKIRMLQREIREQSIEMKEEADWIG